MRRAYRAARVGAALLIAGSVLLVGAATASPLPATTLVAETFTGATADARFQGYGSACLTGAPAAVPGSGGHALGGCPATGTGPLPPTGGAPLGYLELTDASTDRAGAVLFNQPVPAAGGLRVSFQQWQYGSTTPATPADGLSFFLVDGASDLAVPGAFGASLGYAQRLPGDTPGHPVTPGVAHGYLGFGLDTRGDYFGDWEHRGSGCARRSPAGTVFRIPSPGVNTVTVRGPGNGTSGYCFLAATTGNLTGVAPWPSTLPGSLEGPLTTLPSQPTARQADALLDAAKRTVTVQVTPAPDPRVTVDVDFNDGTGPHRVLDLAAPRPVPATYKFGFAASTGTFTNVHLIRDVTVGPLVPLPRLDLVTQAALDPPAGATVGTRVPYQFVVTNTGTAPVTGLAVTAPGVPDVTCPASTLAPLATTVCTGAYRVTRADLDRGRAVVSAVATATGDSGAVASPASAATLALDPGRARLSLSGTADPTRVSAAGQRVSYRFVVTNTGGQTLTGLTVRATGVTAACPTGALPPGHRVTCAATHTVTGADVAAGTVGATATATATTGAGQAVASAPVRVTVAVGLAPTGPDTMSWLRVAGVLIIAGVVLAIAGGLLGPA